MTENPTAAHFADRRRAANVWMFFLRTEHTPEWSREGIDEILESAATEGRLALLLRSVLQVATEIVPELSTAALSEAFALEAMRNAQLEADERVGEWDADSETEFDWHPELDEDDSRG